MLATEKQLKARTRYNELNKLMDDLSYEIQDFVFKYYGTDGDQLQGMFDQMEVYRQERDKLMGDL